LKRYIVELQAQIVEAHVGHRLIEAEDELSEKCQTTVAKGLPCRLDLGEQISVSQGRDGQLVQISGGTDKQLVAQHGPRFGGEFSCPKSKLLVVKVLIGIATHIQGRRQVLLCRIPGQDFDVLDRQGLVAPFFNDLAVPLSQLVRICPRQVWWQVDEYQLV